MAGGFAKSDTSNTSTYAGLGTWLMLPSWLVIGFFLILPVGTVLIYSFLTKEFRGGVIWEFSLAAYDQFFFDRGLFGMTRPRSNGPISTFSGDPSGKQVWQRFSVW